MPDPVMEFSHWVGWDQRESIPGCRSNGVYLLAHFQNAVPIGNASPLEENIIYIGETHHQGLAKRWRDFHRSASTGRKSHAGGMTYYERFKELSGDLYVAASVTFPSSWSERQRCFYIRYAEARLVAEFCLKYRTDKLCNKC